MTTWLTPSEIKECLAKGERIGWHEEYERQEWCDRPGPLEVLCIHCMSLEKDAEKKTFFVGYKCSDPQCRRCTDPTMTVVGHHKMIRPDGLDVFGRVEFIETKKKTITNVVDQPVFRRLT